ncbi:MAG: hypothetical protein ONB23_08145 [candidate division KSB1 bacterium]|nr:hypothetical protein [candidate division KSB1 bacterium]
MRAAALIVSVAVAVLGGSLAYGQASPQQETAQPQEPPALSREVIRVFLDRVEVVGRIDKPQAIFIIPGRNPEVDDIRIDRMFFREIFRKVEYPTGVVRKTEEVVRKEYILW